MGTVRSTGVYMFKWLNKDGKARGGDRPFKYNLPVGGVPGKWHTKKEPNKIKACEYGFHCIGYYNIEDFACYGPRLFLVEVAGTFDTTNEGDGKVAVQSIRLIKELYPEMDDDGEGNIVMSGPFTDNIPKGYIKYVLDNVDGKIGDDPMGAV